MDITVFLADDHAVVRDGLRMVLEAEDDITVIGDAADGRTAVASVRALAPDVVVMDISMPSLNGIEAAAQVRRHCPETQVVVLSMHATSEHVYRAMKAGALGYVLKECAGREVVEAVRAAHARRRFLSERVENTMVDDYVRCRADIPSVSPLSHLSAREKEVLQLVVEGMSSTEIAKCLNLSPKSVETYRARIMQKLDLHDLPSLVKFAIEHGLTPSA